MHFSGHRNSRKSKSAKVLQALADFTNFCLVEAGSFENKAYGFVFYNHLVK